MTIFRTRFRRCSPVRLFVLALFVIAIDLTRVRYRLATISPPARKFRVGPSLHTRERIFISSTHWNNEAVLRSHWNPAVLALTKALGRDHVYVSVTESGSWDDTKGALRELDAQLAVSDINRTIVLSETTHADEISQPPGPTGWVDTPSGKKGLRRIPFLSRQRNESLKPLADLEQKYGLRFDKILFLNDVIFTNDDVSNLLETNDGSYAAACALDFSKPPALYDTFAMRDIEGHEPLMQTWPYFRARQSRIFLEYGKAVPMSSCWNGMVIMDAAPFYDRVSPLRFRGIPDSLAATHLEGSECCLIHADNPVSAQKGVWLNPNVRVGYNAPAYEYVHPSSGGGGSGGSSRNRDAWVSTPEILWGVWQSRLRRWFTTDAVKTWTVLKRLEDWMKADPTESRTEPGSFCLINEMQIVAANGWAHV